MDKDKDIPLVYQLIMDRLKARSYQGELNKNTAKFVMSYLRLPRQLLPPVFNELKELGLIEFINSHKIKIVEP